MFIAFITQTTNFFAGNKIFIISEKMGCNLNWDSYASVYEGEIIPNNSKD